MKLRHDLRAPLWGHIHASGNDIETTGLDSGNQCPPLRRTRVAYFGSHHFENRTKRIHIGSGQIAAIILVGVGDEIVERDIQTVVSCLVIRPSATADPTDVTANDIPIAVAARVVILDFISFLQVKLQIKRHVRPQCPNARKIRELR